MQAVVAPISRQSVRYSDRPGSNISHDISTTTLLLPPPAAAAVASLSALPGLLVPVDSPNSSLANHSGSAGAGSDALTPISPTSDVSELEHTGGGIAGNLGGHASTSGRGGYSDGASTSFKGDGGSSLHHATINSGGTHHRQAPALDPMAALRLLSPFIPQLLLQKLSAAGKEPMVPSMEVLTCAMLVADISGFTALTERALLNRRGTEIVEELTACMNRYFTEAIEILMEYGGDVIKFAGDSMLVAFPLDTAASESLSACALRAAKCGDDLVCTLGAYSPELGGYGTTDYSSANDSDEGLPLARGLSPCGGGLGPTKVLVVDDILPNRVVLGRMLSKLGCEVMHATNGLDAVQQCEQQEFAFVFMDLLMPPGMDGYEATRRIRELGCAAYISAVTGQKESEVRAACQDAGMDGFLVKPITMGTLMKIITPKMGHSTRGRDIGSPAHSRRRPAGAHRLQAGVLGPLTLSLKVMVGIGEMAAFRTGSDVELPSNAPRWEFLLADYNVGDSAAPRRQPIEQIQQADEVANPGDVILSPEIWALVHAVCEGEHLPTGNVRLNKVTAEVPEIVRRERTYTKEEATEVLAQLRPYIPNTIRSRLEAGEKHSLSEIRRCTILFLGLPSLNPKLRNANQLEAVQTAMRVVQGVLKKFEGCLAQFRMDEKGFLMICAYGVLGNTHEDDPARGVASALAIRAGLAQEGQDGVIGLTTGKLFCATVGSKRRCEFTVYGDSINLSARLMKKARNEILVDAATYTETKDIFDYTILPPVQVKGKSMLVPVFRPQGIRPGKSKWAFMEDTAPPTNRMDTSPKNKYPGPLVGRQRETALIMERIKQLTTASTGSVFIVEGLPGIGKTRLVDAVCSSLPDTSCRVLYVAGKSKAELLTPWKRLLSSLLFDKKMTNKQKGLKVLSCLDYSAWPDVLLLADIFGLDFSDQDKDTMAFRSRMDDSPSRMATFPTRIQDQHRRGTAATSTAPDISSLRTSSQSLQHEHPRNMSTPTALDGRTLRASGAEHKLGLGYRAEKICELMQKLLCSIIQPPCILVLEDAHHFDPLSWTVAKQLVDDVSFTFLLLIVMRPMEDKLSPIEFSAIEALPVTMKVRLTELTEEEARTLVSKIVGPQKASQLPEAYYSTIYQKTKGQPLFVEQMAVAISSSDINQSLETETLTRPIEALITSKIDQLNPIDVLMLKIASVIGTSFSTKLLQAVLNSQLARERRTAGNNDDEVVFLNDHQFMIGLRELEQRKWFTRRREDGKGMYHFTNFLSRDVMYEMIPISQRRTIHTDVAAKLFEMSDNNNVPSAMVAYHYTLACRDVEHYENDLLENAIQHWERAAEHALHTFGQHVTAIRYYKEAVALGEIARNDISASRRAIWERRIAYAYMAIGDLDASIEHVISALKALDEPIPDVHEMSRRSQIERVRSNCRTGCGSICAELFLKAFYSRHTRLIPRPTTPMNDVVMAIEFRLQALYDLTSIALCKNDVALATYACLRYLNLTESLDGSHIEPSIEMARAYSIACAIAEDPEYAYEYQVRCLEIQGMCTSADESIYTADILYNIAVNSVTRGDWQKAEEYAFEATTIFVSFQDQRQVDMCQCITAVANYHQGNFDSCQTAAELLHSSRLGHPDLRLWGLCLLLASLNGLRKYKKAMTVLRAYQTKEDEMAIAPAPTIMKLCVNIVGCESCWRSGQLHSQQEAVLVALTLLPELLAIKPFTPLYPMAMVSLLEVLLESLSIEITGVTLQQRQLAVTKLMKALHRLAYRMTFMYVYVSFFKGKLAAIKGQRKKAAKRFHQAFNDAMHTGMRHVQRVANGLFHDNNHDIGHHLS